MLDGQRYWRIPVMEGEFLVQETFGVQKAIGGGNFLILAKDQPTALSAAEAAVGAMRKVRGVVLPFPGRNRARRQQSRREELQEHDRVDQRCVLPDAPRTRRRHEPDPGRRELGARDRRGRTGSRCHRERDARRHRRRLPTRRRRDHRPATTAASSESITFICTNCSVKSQLPTSEARPNSRMFWELEVGLWELI